MRRQIAVGAVAEAQASSRGNRMIAAGVDLATVSALLGHAGVRVMAAVYVHATSRSPADTIGKFER